MMGIFAGFCYLLDKIAHVAVVFPNELEAGKTLKKRFQKLFADDPIYEIGSMDQDTQDQAVGVDQEMSIECIHALTFYPRKCYNTLGQRCYF
jgi:hypothetical protein